MESDIDYEFRTTCVKPFINTEIIRNILYYIKGANKYILQQFSQTDVLDPKWSENKDNFYTDDELKQFEFMVKQHVKKCFVR